MPPTPSPDAQRSAQNAAQRDAILTFLEHWLMTRDDAPPGSWAGIIAELELLVTKAARYEYLCTQARSTISFQRPDTLLWYIPGAWRGTTFDHAIDQAREAS
jgi:hypothetical protein